MQKQAYPVFFKEMPTQDVYIDETPSSLPDSDISFLHYHDRYEVGICLQGEGIFITADRVEIITAGDLLFFPPGTKHYSRSVERCLCRFVYVNADTVSQLPTAVVPCVWREGMAGYEELRRLMADIDRPQARERVVLRLNLFIIEINHAFSVHPHEPSSEPMADYLTERYNQPLTTKDMAAAFHLSESQLRRRFIAQYDVPPMVYRNRLRCRIGRELLMHTDRTIADIAEHLGFSAPSDFYRLFRKYYGISPRQVRIKKDFE